MMIFYSAGKIFQIQAIVYSSLGTCLSLSYKFKKNIWLNFATQSFSGSMLIDSNDRSTREDVDYEFQTKYINMRNYLTSIFSEFFIQYGFISTNEDTRSIIKSNETNQNKAEYKTNYPNTGINFGIGMN